MEKVLTDIINAGIAVFRTSEENLKASLTNLQAKFNEIKAKGEADQSEQAVQVRELLNKTIKDSQELLDKVNQNYNDVYANVQANFKEISEKVETALPEQVKTSAKTALDEFKAMIEKYKPANGGASASTK